MKSILPRLKSVDFCRKDAIAEQINVSKLSKRRNYPIVHVRYSNTTVSNTHGGQNGEIVRQNVAQNGRGLANSPCFAVILPSRKRLIATPKGQNVSGGIARVNR